jgi:hypothetical protein
VADRSVHLMVEVTYQAEPGQVAAFRAALARWAPARACRTCDYGNDPACGHEGRAERVCAAPVGDFDCAVVPCLGSCANPAGGASWTS